MTANDIENQQQRQEGIDGEASLSSSSSISEDWQLSGHGTTVLVRKASPRRAGRRPQPQQQPQPNNFYHHPRAVNNEDDSESEAVSKDYGSSRKIAAEQLKEQEQEASPIRNPPPTIKKKQSKTQSNIPKEIVLSSPSRLCNLRCLALALLVPVVVILLMVLLPNTIWRHNTTNNDDNRLRETTTPSPSPSPTIRKIPATTLEPTTASEHNHHHHHDDKIWTANGLVTHDMQHATHDTPLTFYSLHASMQQQQQQHAVNLTLVLPTGDKDTPTRQALYIYQATTTKTTHHEAKRNQPCSRQEHWDLLRVASAASTIHLSPPFTKHHHHQGTVVVVCLQDRPVATAVAIPVPTLQPHETFRFELLDFGNPKTTARNIKTRIDDTVNHVFVGVVTPPPSSSTSYVYVPFTRQISDLKSHLGLSAHGDEEKDSATKQQQQQSSSSSSYHYCPLPNTQRDDLPVVLDDGVFPLTLWDMSDMKTGDFPSLVLVCGDDNQALLDVGYLHITKAK